MPSAASARRRRGIADGLMAVREQHDARDVAGRQLGARLAQRQLEVEAPRLTDRRPTRRGSTARGRAAPPCRRRRRIVTKGDDAECAGLSAG